MSKLFNVGDVVKINWEEFSKNFGSDLEELKSDYFNTATANEYADNGTFTIKGIFHLGTYDDGTVYVGYRLSPNVLLQPTDFVHEETILETINDTLDKAQEIGYIIFDNEDLMDAE